jgi:thiol-disulfide isomerase/thioredoxin
MRKIKAFGDANCPKCKKMRPILDELYAEGFDIEFFPIDGNEELFFQEEIESYPTLKFYDSSGRIYHRTVGVVEKQRVIDIYKRVI